jgi:enoyl-CoA hydratase/carnithine racemase
METLLLEKADGIAWLTLNRPQVLNAFNWTMQEELRAAWRALHVDPDVRVIVLTGAGDRAFCTGVDRESVDPRAVSEDEELPGWTTPWTDHATFFEPHLQAGIPAIYEPVQLVQKVPFQEVMRMALLGSHERMSARRAFEIGLVSEIVPKEELHDAAEWAARAIASADPLPVMGTVRAIWNARDVPRRQALDLAYLYVRNGQDRGVMRQSMERFSSGGRVEWRLR